MVYFRGLNLVHISTIRVAYEDRGRVSVATGPKAREPARGPARFGPSKSGPGPARPVSSRPVLAGVYIYYKYFIIQHSRILLIHIYNICMLLILNLYLYGVIIKCFLLRFHGAKRRKFFLFKGPFRPVKNKARPVASTGPQARPGPSDFRPGPARPV